eukprot:scaffold8259_cov62-Cyclotella_meneghiniana.AAC.3
MLPSNAPRRRLVSHQWRCSPAFLGSGASIELFDIGAIEEDCWPRCCGHERLQQCHVGRCSKVAERSAVLYVAIYEQRGVDKLGPALSLEMRKQPTKKHLAAVWCQVCSRQKRR